jgi:ABC-type polysaccharide/polyol phosphate export permease
MALYLDVVRYPDLFASLFRRELFARYKGSFLGLLWTLVNPLVLVGVYTLVFSVLWRAVSVPHYPLFIISGLAAWVFFQASVQISSSSLVAQANLVKQVRFPRQLIPLAVVGTNLVAFAAMLLVVAAFNLALIPATRTTIWAVVPLSLPLIGLAAGLGLVVAGLTALFRDVEHLLLTIFVPWFFITPIFYDLRQLPGVQNHPHLADVIHWGNPVTPMVEAVRAPLFYGTYPSLGELAYSVLVALAALALGAFVFHRVDDELAIQL